MTSPQTDEASGSADLDEDLQRDLGLVVDGLAQRRCVLILGDGIQVMSRGKRVDLTKELANDLAVRLDAGNGSGRHEEGTHWNLTHIAQRFVKEIEGGHYELESEVKRFHREVLDDSLDDPAFRALASLPFQTILTTRLDHTIDRYLRDAGKDPQVHSFDYNGEAPDQLPAGTERAPIVYYLGGELDAPLSAVITDEDVLKSLAKIVADKPGLPSLIRAEVSKPGQMLMLAGIGVRRCYVRLLLDALGRGDGDRRISVALGEPPAQNRAVDLEADHFFRDRFRIRTHFGDAETIERTMTELASAYAATVGPTDTPSTSAPQPTSTPTGPSVFISYCGDDGEQARELYSRMVAEGLDPFLDKKGLGAGEDWWEALERKIRSVDFFVLLLSQQLAGRLETEVNREIDTAVHRQGGFNKGHVFIMPVFLDNEPETHDYLQRLGDISRGHAPHISEVDLLISQIRKESARRAHQR